jgi:O-antigen ligase
MTRRLLAFLPDDEWRNIRVLSFFAGSCLLVLTSTGVVAQKLFSQPTDTKYLVTVVGAGIVVFLATVRSPLRIVVFLAILAAPLGFVFSFEGLQPTPLIAVNLVGLCIALPRRMTSRSFLVPAAGAFALLLLPAIFGSDDTGYYLVWLAVTLSTGWLTYLLAREPGGPALIALAVTIVALLEGALAVWEFKTNRQLNLYQGSASTVTSGSYFFSYAGFFRPDGTLPEPIALGQVLCLCIPVSIAYSASQARRSLAFFAMAATGVAALGLTLSLDRASTIGGLVGTIVTLVLLPRGLRGRSALFVVIVLALVVLFALGIAPGAVNARISSIFNPTSAHVSTASGDLLRLRLWSAALKTAAANLVTGVGFGNITEWLPRYGVSINSAAQAQNAYLQMFAEGGILGLVAILGIVGAASRDLVRGFSPNRVWVAGLTGALVASLIAWVTDFEIRYEEVSGMLAILLALIAALVDGRRTVGVSSTIGARE